VLLQPVCLCLSVCLSVCLDHPSLSTTVRPACVCSTAPRSSLLDPHCSSLPRFSLLASRSSRPPSPGPGQPGKAEDPPPPPGNPAARKVPLPKSPLLDTPPKSDKAAGPLHTSARPRPPLVRARVCLTEQASHDASLPPSLSPSLPTNPIHGHLHHTRHLVVARTHHSYLTTYTRAGDDSHNTQTALHSQR
jgi:hypothetical protein